MNLDRSLEEIESEIKILADYPLPSKKALERFAKRLQDLAKKVEKATREVERGRATPEQCEAYVGLVFQIGALNQVSNERVAQAGNAIANDLLSSALRKGARP
jgi:hypothetical protein